MRVDTCVVNLKQQTLWQ